MAPVAHKAALASATNLQAAALLAALAAAGIKVEALASATNLQAEALLAALGIGTAIAYLAGSGA